MRRAALILLALAAGAVAWAGWSAPLGGALFRLDPALLNTVQAGIQRHLAPWIWDELALPLLEQPAWLVPAVLGFGLLALRLLRR
jgi:hypothetical protein